MDGQWSEGEFHGEDNTYYYNKNKIEMLKGEWNVCTNYVRAMC